MLVNHHRFTTIHSTTSINLCRAPWLKPEGTFSREHPETSLLCSACNNQQVANQVYCNSTLKLAMIHVRASSLRCHIGLYRALQPHSLTTSRPFLCTLSHLRKPSETTSPFTCSSPVHRVPKPLSHDNFSKPRPSGLLICRFGAANSSDDSTGSCTTLPRCSACCTTWENRRLRLTADAIYLPPF